MMRSLIGSKSILAVFLFLTPLVALALNSDDDAAAAVGCLACSGFFIFLIVAFVVLHIVLLVWVARDAKSRGMDSAILWMLLVFFLGLIGLIIYLFARPQGNLIQCPKCNNKRLQVSAQCPHCGNA